MNSNLECFRQYCTSLDMSRPILTRLDQLEKLICHIQVDSIRQCLQCMMEELIAVFTRFLWGVYTRSRIPPLWLSLSIGNPQRCHPIHSTLLKLRQNDLVQVESQVQGSHYQSLLRVVHGHQPRKQRFEISSQYKALHT